jgi:hypothetical protein
MLNYLKSIKISLRTVVVAIVLAITLFLTFLESSKRYGATMSVMVIPKSEIAVKQKDEITANMQTVAGMLSFYDRVLSDNPQIKDSTAGKTPDERKAAWNQFTKATKRKDLNNSIVDITVYAKKQTDAIILVEKTTNELITVMSGYYNIKNDVDLRIVDGPVAKVSVPYWYWLILVSAALGFVISLLLQEGAELAKELAGKKFSKGSAFNRLDEYLAKQQGPRMTKIEDAYLPEEREILEKQATKPQEEPQKEQKVEEVVHFKHEYSYPNFPEMPVDHVKKSAAPDNLPIQDFAWNEPKVEESVKVEERPQPKSEDEEPTEEELKRRLNQLLKGNL